MVFPYVFHQNKNKVATPKLDFQRHTGGSALPRGTEPEISEPRVTGPLGSGLKMRARERGITAWYENHQLHGGQSTH